MRESIRNDKRSYKVAVLTTNTPYQLDAGPMTEFRLEDGYDITAKHAGEEVVFIVSRNNVVSRINNRHIKSWSGPMGMAEV